MLGLAGAPRQHCRSPFRDDQRPSFSVYKAGDGERWYDHGEARGGDVIDLWARAKEISVKEALTEMLALVPGASSLAKAPNRPPETFLPLPGIRWPSDLREPTPSECIELGRLRNLPPLAFWTARLLGTLKVATIGKERSWILTDLSGICAEARRFDGQPFVKPNGDKLKSFALSGSKKFWPVGLQTNNPSLNHCGRILLVEGGPDYFAALALAIEAPINFRPAAMLGASTNIGLEAAKYIRGAQVVIIPHNDLAGALSEDRWTEQTKAAGAIKIVVQHLPFEVDDLNDFLRLNPQEPSVLLQGFEPHGYSPAARI
jgi:hypothetical protein